MTQPTSPPPTLHYAKPDPQNTSSDFPQRRVSGASTQVSSAGDDDGTCVDSELQSPAQSLRNAATTDERDDSAVESDSVWSTNGTSAPMTPVRAPHPTRNAHIPHTPAVNTRLGPIAEAIPRISRTSRPQGAGVPLGHWLSPPAPAYFPPPQATDGDYESDFPRHRKRKADQLHVANTEAVSATTYAHATPIERPSPSSSSIHSPAAYAGSDEPGPSRPYKQRKTVSADEADPSFDDSQPSSSKRTKGGATKARWDPMTATLNDWITSAIETGTALRGRKKILENTICRLCGGDTKHSSPGRHLKTHHRGTLGQRFAKNENELEASEMVLLCHFTLSHVQNNLPDAMKDANLAQDINRFLHDYPDVLPSDIDHSVAFDAKHSYPALYRQVRLFSQGSNFVCEWCDTPCSRSDALNRHLRTVCTMIPEDVRTQLVAAFKGKAAGATRRRRGDKTSRRKKASPSSSNDEDDEYDEDDD